MKRLLSTAFALALAVVLLSGQAVQAFAVDLETTTGTTEDQIVHAENGDLDAGLNTYSIRIYGGNRGLINNEEFFEWKNYCTYGDKIDLSNFNLRVVMTDAKYYPKGIRLAGYDNVKDVRYAAVADDRNFLVGTITVTGDADYVVAYGVAADRVAYTVRYVDQQGAEIASAQTYYGDIGDRPAATAAYIEGYVPTAYEIVRTISDDPKSNVFTFVYSRLAQGYTTVQNPNGTIDIVTPTGVSVNAPGTASSTTTSTNTATGQNNTAAATSGTTGTTDTDGTGASGTGSAPSANAQLPTTDVITTPDGEVIYDENGVPISQPVSVDLQDEVVPLGSFTGESSEEGEIQAPAPDNTGMIVAAVAVGIGVVVLIVALIIYLRKRSEERLWAW